MYNHAVWKEGFINTIFLRYKSFSQSLIYSGLISSMVVIFRKVIKKYAKTNFEPIFLLNLILWVLGDHIQYFSFQNHHFQKFDFSPILNTFEALCAPTKQLNLPKYSIIFSNPFHCNQWPWLGRLHRHME